MLVRMSLCLISSTCSKILFLKNIGFLLYKAMKINASSLKNAFLCKQVLGTAASCLICLISGITLGISAVMLPQLRDDKTIQYNPDDDSWIASIVMLSMIAGSLLSGQILDSCGRKVAHIILTIPYIIGWIVIGYASSTTTILIGRFITGISSGANKAVSLVYIGEIVDPKIRTAALLFPCIITLIGTLIVHILGYYVPWQLCSKICVVPGVLSLIIFLFLKESPLWLIAKGRINEGVEVFRWFRGTDPASEAELQAILQKKSEKPNISMKETLKIACTIAFIKPMMILMVVILTMNLSGMNVVKFYSQDIFERTFSGNVDSFAMTMTMDCIRIILPVAFCILQKCIRKKFAFLASSVGVPVFVFGFIACLMVDYKSFVWLPVSCLVIYMCFSSVIIAIGWTFIPEVLPSTARGLGAGLNSAFSYVLLFILLKITPYLLDSYGVIPLFAIFGVVTLICWIVLMFILPETNGKTLQSIEDNYGKDDIATKS